MTAEARAAHPDGIQVTQMAKEESFGISKLEHAQAGTGRFQNSGQIRQKNIPEQVRLIDTPIGGYFIPSMLQNLGFTRIVSEEP